jgi:hypothetical protein
MWIKDVRVYRQDRRIQMRDDKRGDKVLRRCPDPDQTLVSPG